ncbi:hypothetical protein ACFV8T_03380 [Streptomyces sp. NPDC059832]|uniref:hypothetical protein n=1 Tax=Streptomyces sp. NPDC059832 TaxID=3346966 RepID=UPI003661A296
MPESQNLDHHAASKKYSTTPCGNGGNGIRSTRISNSPSPPIGNFIHFAEFTLATPCAFSHSARAPFLDTARADHAQRIRGTSILESDDDFDIADQYDSIEDPWLRSEFLDAIGKTRSFIDALRRSRDFARAKAAAARDEPAASARGKEARRRAPRTRRRTRVAVTRPPNKGRVRRRCPRPRPRVVLVIVLDLD